MSDSLEARMDATIRVYSEQGIHRTGTDVDHQQAAWLANQIEGLGLPARLDEFAFERLVPLEAKLVLPDGEYEGLPLFDCTYPAGPVSGKLADLGQPGDVGVLFGTLGAAAPRPDLEAARRGTDYRALVVVVNEGLPATGVAALNAEAFRAPYGVPVLQLPAGAAGPVRAAMAAGASVELRLDWEYRPAVAQNVGTTIEGSDTGLEPIVIMTPRSAWWRCAAERGGGLAVFLELMACMAREQPRRRIEFTANTGHELGHLGLDHFLEGRGDLLQGASVWIHLGANFAARLGGEVRLQYADEAARTDVRRLAAAHGANIDAETPIGQRPGGEARNVFDGGGRYVSILGTNGLFHHPADIWPDAVDVAKTARWCRVFTDYLRQAAFASD